MRSCERSGQRWNVSGRNSTAATEKDRVRTVDAVIDRLRAEFMEMPGLRLTSEQVQRLCGVERMVCQTVLDELVKMKFLCRKPDGAYARLTDGEMSRRRPAKAELQPNRISEKAS
jgi:hypothetical protein